MIEQFLSGLLDPSDGVKSPATFKGMFKNERNVKFLTLNIREIDIVYDIHIQGVIDL